MIETNRQYRMSFSTGGLFLKESLLVIASFCRLNSWNEVREQVLKDNLLQARTAATLKRNTQEIILRLKHLSDGVILQMPGLMPEIQRKIIWFAVCETYDFIREFAVEVIRQKHLTMQYHVDNSDFNEFFNTKQVWHPELETISQQTLAKLRQVLFKIVREAEIINDNGLIIPFAGLSHTPAELAGNRRFLEVLPVSNADFKRFVSK